MTTRRSGNIWPWLLISVLAAGTLMFAGSFVWRIFHPPVTPFVDDTNEKQVPIQLEVVNASGIAGAGKRTMKFLRERGFDVVEVATDTARRRTTLILDRMGDRTSALKVAAVLGLADSLVKSDLDSMRFIRASVMLGADCSSLPPFAH